MYKMMFGKFVDLVKERRQTMRVSDWGGVSFLKEYGTFSLNMGRQTGKTTSIMEYMKEHQNSCAIVFKMAHVKDLESRFPECKGRIFTVYGYIRAVLELHKKFDTVFLDDPMYINNVDTIYKNLEDKDFVDSSGIQSLIKVGM